MNSYIWIFQFFLFLFRWLISLHISSPLQFGLFHSFRLFCYFYKNYSDILQLINSLKKIVELHAYCIYIYILRKYAISIVLRGYGNGKRNTHYLVYGHFLLFAVCRCCFFFQWKLKKYIRCSRFAVCIHFITNCTGDRVCGWWCTIDIFLFCLYLIEHECERQYAEDNQW